MYSQKVQKRKNIWVVMFTYVVVFVGIGSVVYVIKNQNQAPEQSKASFIPNQIPKPNFTLLDSISPVKMYFNDDTGYQNAEIAPWSLENKKLGGNYLFLVTTFDTYLCDTESNIFALTSFAKITSCKLRQSSAVTPNSFDNSPERQKALWSRDYYGAFSGHLVDIKNKGWQMYLINHGELLNNNYFPSQPCRPAPDIGYGSFPCGTPDSDKTYNAFVGMSNFSFTSSNFYSTNKFEDLGPIVWPANGYVENGKKATYLGILHPSSIIKDGYIYVFFRDTSQGTEEGRTAGLKVARASITDNGINPGGFKTYFKGNFSDNALPQGFDKNNIMSHFSQKGGRSTPLFANDVTTSYVPDVYSFSVAKIKGTKWYLGVAQDLHLGVTLRFSDDLVNWSQQTVVPGTEFDYFAPNGGTPNFIKQPFMYTRLANSNGDSNVEIDPNDFYIVGNTKGTNPFNGAAADIINKVHVKLNNVPSDVTSTVTKTPTAVPTSSPTSTKTPTLTATKTSAPTKTPTATPRPSVIISIYDLDDDGLLTIKDYSQFVKYYIITDSKIDFNKDGKVNITDFSMFKNEYIKSSQ